MLTGSYLKINNETVSIPPKKFDMKFNAIEQVNQSEAGTDLVDATRLKKRVISLAWEGVDSSFTDKLESWVTAATVSVTYRSDTFDCRARDYSVAMAFKSYLYASSDGLWDASLTLTEI